MKKLTALFVIVLLVSGFVVSCTPDPLLSNQDSIELVDKDKNVRPGSQESNEETAENDSDDSTDGSN
ncbi:hypothetical protein EZY14_016455 [Kordia sp. TARA_039_SRF]|nr:hypothetical protein EZY14_016455 [Kordia sp. TARA_039_SRF]